MNNIVIKVENLSKQYRLGSVGTGSFANDLNRTWHLVRGKDDPYLMVGEENDRTQKGSSDYVWALKDINFEVKHGEVLGIIGRNGAGKSTLLKILSRTTSPTTGSVKIKGRVASLLEVGTGFHPELTGRENIFLNGAILGMTKQEIKRKFDEIVDFSGVERYIDTPVKRYSSGMYVRLAFAVAAHLDPEVLIVDEVLAVGDAEFQKKALGKMKDISQNQGRTVLFVSHNMAAIKNLCDVAIIIKTGQLSFKGAIDEALNEYINEQSKKSNLKISEVERLSGNGLLRFTDIRFRDNNEHERTKFAIGESLQIDIYYDADPRLLNCRNSRIDIGINDILGNRITWLSSFIYQDKINPKDNYISFLVPKILLGQGTYNVSLYCDTSEGNADWIQNASKLTIHDNDFFGSGRTIPDGHGKLVTEFTIK